MKYEQWVFESLTNTLNAVRQISSLFFKKNFKFFIIKYVLVFLSKSMHLYLPSESGVFHLQSSHSSSKEMFFCDITTVTIV